MLNQNLGEKSSCPVFGEKLWPAVQTNMPSFLWENTLPRLNFLLTTGLIINTQNRPGDQGNMEKFLAE